MAESANLKTSTRQQRLMRSVYAFIGCGVGSVMLVYPFVFIGSGLAYRVPGMGWLIWPIVYFNKLIHPVAQWLMPLMYPHGLPMYPGRMILFHLILYFIVGLIVGLPVVIVVYFIPPRARDGR